MNHERASLESGFLWLLPINSSPVVGNGTVIEAQPNLSGPYVKAWSTPHRRWYNAASGGRRGFTIAL